MFERMLLLKIDNKFHGVFLFVFLLLCYLCLFNALQIVVDARIFEEDRRKDRE